MLRRTGVIAVWRPPLNLAMIAAYHKMRKATDKQRLYYQRVIKQVDTIVGRIAEEYCDSELVYIEELQRELRMITKGTPVTEALTPADKEPILTTKPGYNQRQYDALTQVLKRTYRKLAMLCHPDRGGDPTVFYEVEVAYGMRDINRLNAIYLSIAEGRNLYWQQDAGVYHVSTEFERYRVELEMMQQTAGWLATRLYLNKQVNKAAEVVRAYLNDKAAALLNEIHHVVNQGKDHGKERNPEGKEIEQRQIGESQIEDAGGQESQSTGRQGAESTGESAPG